MTVDLPCRDTRARTALVVGANGFLGGFVAAALARRGWRVLPGVRSLSTKSDERRCDFATMHTPDAWRAALVGVDAVVNVAGILREQGSQTFENIHVIGPTALATAAMHLGIGCFVQVSALGSPEDGEFVASKHRFDDILLAMPLDSAVLRPSLVYSVAGSYGGSSLLRALAGFPGVQLLPGGGRWLVQPLAAEDLGALVVRAAEGAMEGIYEVGGPEQMSLLSYQSRWRQWLRIPGARVLRVPESLVSIGVWVGERLGRGPVGETMWRMLKRGNFTRDDALSRLRDATGFSPRPMSEVLAERPSQVQDRWQAQLYFLAPTLHWAIVIVWMLSACAGLATSGSRIEALAADSILLQAAPVALARGMAVVDLLLALWLLCGWRPRWAIGLMGVSVAIYTIAFGTALPSLWLDPLGGLAKNLIILPALATAWVLAEQR